MNCKFCNNFIPDDAKVCSICGKNIEEEALVKAEPETVAIAETAGIAENKAEKVYKKKSLKFPSVLIILAVVAFICIYTFGNGTAGCAQVRGWLADKMDGASQTVSETDKTESDGITVDVGTSTEKTEQKNADEGVFNTVMATIGANGAAGLAGLAGVALLGKRAVGNSKAKKQEKAAK